MLLAVILLGVIGVRRQLERFPGAADVLAEDDGDVRIDELPKAGEDDTRDLWRADEGHDPTGPRL